MDMKRFGNFLKSLRKEKGITQEQLGEIFGVSPRTVSRWETGTNLPDIGQLFSLSDFFGVDVRELVDGERKTQKSDCSETDSIKTVSEYADIKEKMLIRKIIIVVVSCAVSWVVSLLCALQYIEGLTGGIIILTEMLFCFVVYSIIVFPRKANRTADGVLLSITGMFAASVVANLMLYIAYFADGGYHNYGLFGGYLFGLLFFLIFIASAVIVSLINGKHFRKSRRAVEKGGAEIK